MSLHIRRMDELAYYKEYFGQLVGARIESFDMRHDKEFDDWWPTFTLILADGTKTKIEISSDEEGNSPGFIFIN